MRVKHRGKILSEPANAPRRASRRIELLCLGTELLKDKVNTNSNLIAEKIAKAGLSLSQVTTVGDLSKDILQALKDALNRSDIVLTCGGLGPTFDDLTRECVSKTLKKPLVFSQPILNQIERRFDSVGLPMAEENKRQAYLIAKARPVLNKVGTAPGQIIEHKGKCLILLPGPPKELTPMMDEAVGPYLKKKYSKSVVSSLVLHVFGYPESQIDEIIQPVVQKNWDSKSTKTTFGILAHHSIIDVKFTVEGKRKSQVSEAASRIKKALYQILGEKIYGENEDSLERAVGKILKKRRQTLAAAESCTGGLISHKITNVPGSSVYFKEGVVTYSNESKRGLLGVKRETIRKFGAVSNETAEEMARGILKRSGSIWGLSVTGIAGPTGGTALKPVGLVFFGLASKNGVHSWKKNFFGTRTEIKERAALTALNLLRIQLKSI